MDHGLPNDHDKLAWMLGCSRADFDVFWSLVSPLFEVITTGQLYDSELLVKWNDSEKRAETSRVNGNLNKPSRNRRKPNRYPKEPSGYPTQPSLAGAGEGIGIGQGTGNGSGSPKQLTRDQLLDGWFERTWKDHPRKVGKESAREVYKKLFGPVPDPSFAYFINEALLREVPKYKKLMEDGKEHSIKHFSGYLNERRYMDHEDALREKVDAFRRAKLESGPA